MSEAAACRRCRYYSAIDDDRGECRLRPPQVMVDPDATIGSNFPIVRAEDWCGAFSAKDSDSG